MDSLEERQAARYKADEDAAMAWYQLKGCMQAVKRHDETLQDIYKDSPDLEKQRLSNIELLIATADQLIAEHTK